MKRFAERLIVGDQGAGLFEQISGGLRDGSSCGRTGRGLGRSADHVEEHAGYLLHVVRAGDEEFADGGGDLAATAAAFDPDARRGEASEEVGQFGELLAVAAGEVGDIVGLHAAFKGAAQLGEEGSEAAMIVGGLTGDEGVVDDPGGADVRIAVDVAMAVDGDPDDV